MYGGYNAPCKSVSSYAEAEARLAKFSKTATGRDRVSDNRGAYRMSRTSTVRRTSGGAIAFRLHNTDCVTWDPDGSFSLEAWESVTTGQFSSHFSPVSVNATAYALFDGPDTAALRDSDGWRGYWGSRQLCHGSPRFTQGEDGRWVPDVDTCDEFVTLQLSSASAARAVSKAHNMVEFGHFIAMAPNMVDIEHAGENLDAVADALKARKFLDAIRHLPLVSPTRSFGVKLKPYRVSCPYDKFVTPTSIQRLRDWLYDQEGLLERTTRRIMGASEYDRLVKRSASYGRSDVSDAYYLGWR